MIKYIVTWCIIIGYTHERSIKTDEFGRTIYGKCKKVDVTDCNHKKEFSNRDSAVAFYNRALCTTYANHSGIQQLKNIKLDSIR